MGVMGVRRMKMLHDINEIIKRYKGLDLLDALDLAREEVKNVHKKVGE